MDLKKHTFCLNNIPKLVPECFRCLYEADLQEAPKDYLPEKEKYSNRHDVLFFIPYSQPIEITLTVNPRLNPG